MPEPKAIEFRGDALDALRAFPAAARREAGHQLDRVQHGRDPDDWKPMTSVGSGVREIRIWDEEGAFRALCREIRRHLRTVLFQKKTQRTNKHDLALGESRYRDLARELGK